MSYRRDFAIMSYIISYIPNCDILEIILRDNHLPERFISAPRYHSHRAVVVTYFSMYSVVNEYNNIAPTCNFLFSISMHYNIDNIEVVFILTFYLMID